MREMVQAAHCAKLIFQRSMQLHSRQRWLVRHGNSPHRRGMSITRLRATPQARVQGRLDSPCWRVDACGHPDPSRVHDSQKIILVHPNCVDLLGREPAQEIEYGSLVITQALVAPCQFDRNDGGAAIGGFPPTRSASAAAPVARAGPRKSPIRK